MSKIIKLSPNSLPANRIQRGDLPEEVKASLAELYFAFSDPGRKGETEQAITIASYHRALDGKDKGIALWCIEHLILHNPNNPFRPTAQDLYELIRKQEIAVRNNVLEFYLGRRDGDYYSTPRKVRGKLPFEIPPAMEIEILMEKLPDIEFKCDFSQEYIDRIPRAAWPPGRYEEACAELRRNEEVRRAQELREEEERRRRLEKYGRSA